jgi:hypothetical protein
MRGCAVLAVLAGLLLGLGPALAPRARAQGKPLAWIELRTPHFLIISNGKEKAARRVGLQLEQIRAALERSFPGFRTGTQDDMVVLALKDEPSMLALVSSPQARKLLELQAGVFLNAGDHSCLLLRLDREDDDYHPAFHEYVHALLALNFPHLPLWLEEGLAEFYSGARFDAHGARIGSDGWQTRYLRGRHHLRLETLRAVLPTSAAYRDPERAQLFYAESWALIRFLSFGPGMEQGAKFDQYLARLQQGEDEGLAFAGIFGRLPELQEPFEQFQRSFALPLLRLAGLPACDPKAFALRPLPDQEWLALEDSLQIPEHFSQSLSTPRP